MDEPNGELYNEEQYNKILSNLLASIFSQCQDIGKFSFIKVLHKASNLMLLSKTSGKAIKTKDRNIQLLTNYELSYT